MTWHNTSHHIASNDVTITWPDPGTDIKTSKHFTSKHKTSPPWKGRRLVHSKEMIWASRWSVTMRTFYRQILSVLYSSFPFGNFRPRLVRALLVFNYFFFVVKIWGLNLSCLLPKPAWEEVTVWRPCSFSISSGILRSIPWFSWASRFASPLGILEHLMLVGDPTVPLGWKLLFKSHREDVSQLKREDHAWRSPNSQFCGWDLFLKTFCRISRSAISWSFLTFQMMQAQKCVADWKLMFKNLAAKRKW